jgi:hypothetical protein
MIKVTTYKTRSFSEKRINGARAYVNSSVGKVVDEFFHDNKIYALKFKCNTWNALKRKAVESDIADLKIIFGEEATIRWSKTAGCSPGYVVDGKIDGKYRNSDVWIDIDSSTAHLTKLLPDFSKRLQAEITKKNS